MGGGSNAIGLFTAFIDDTDVRLVGIEAGGDGVETGRHAATITGGDVGVLHGARSFLLQDEDGQTIESHSISAGLDYPGVGPEHSYLADTGRASYVPATDAEAMSAFDLLCKTEGIIPAIESAHALAGALELAKELGPDSTILVNLSGRGDKDVHTAAEYFGLIDEPVVLEQGSRGMSAIDELFDRTRAENRAALVGYLPAGFPYKELSIKAIEAMVEGGVDLVEVGLPYSDPVMDGPTIQAAADQALRAGTRTTDVIDVVRASAATGAPTVDHDLLEPGRALRRRPVRRGPGRGRGSRSHHARPDPRRGSRVDRRLRASTGSTGSSWSRRRRPTSAWR